MPVPSGFNNVVDPGEAGLPAKFGFGAVGGGDEARGVPFAGGHHVDGYFFPGYFAAGVNDLQDRVTFAGAEVEEATLFAFQSFEMGRGQILDVDEIPDAGAVWSGVSISENGDGIALAKGNFEDIWDEMGFDAVMFTEPGGGTGGVEVAEGGEDDAVDLFVPLEDLFKDELAVAVGIDRFLGAAFVERYFFRDTVGGAGGGKNDFAAAGFDHGIKEVHAPGDVGLVVAGGMFHGFRDECLSGKVDDGVGFFLSDGSSEAFAVEEIADDEFSPWIDGGFMSLR